MCSRWASNYKIQVTPSVFSGLSVRVSVPCPRVRVAETSNIPMLYEAFQPNYQCNSSVGFVQINDKTITVFKCVSYIDSYRIYKNAKK